MFMQTDGDKNKFLHLTYVLGYGPVRSIVVQDPEAGTNGPSRKELVFTKPAVIAEGSKTKSVEPFSFSKIQRDIANIDLATG